LNNAKRNFLLTKKSKMTVLYFKKLITFAEIKLN